MDISLNGREWKFKGYIPYFANYRKPWAAPTDFESWPNASVPGNVQLDLVMLGKIEHPYVDFYSRDAEWVACRQWVYTRTFVIPDEADGKRVRLIFDGVDYEATFFLDDQELGRRKNLYIPAAFDITERVEPGAEYRVTVLIEPSPNEYSQLGWTSKVTTVKPRVGYGWDFSTRCISIGIWDNVRLSIDSGLHIADCWADASLSQDLKIGSVVFRTQIESTINAETQLSVSVLKDETVVAESVRRVSVKSSLNEVAAELEVPDVDLWWPNGMGEPNRYQAQVELRSSDGEILDEKTFFFGFKQVRLVPHDGCEKDRFPFCFEVNGRKTFIKGWNWTPIDLLYGGEYSAKYERLIALAAAANVNLLRVWGGGIIEKSLFYDLCDRYGIMVWQEFTLSSSGLDDLAPSNPEYLKLLRETAESVIPSRRNYVSHTVWCTGNELTYKFEEDAAMRLIHEMCAKLDPSKPFIPTSPVADFSSGYKEGDDIHGHWLHLGPEEHYRHYNSIKPSFHSEFGTEGAANLENIPKFIKNAELWPPSKENEIWSLRNEWHITYDVFCEVFGEPENIEEYVRLSQFWQWEGLRYIIEAALRRQFSCGGVIPWQFNEPWPNLICTNAVDYYTTPKMAYYAVASAYEPVHVSAKYAKLNWRPGESLDVEVWVTNALGEIQNASVETSITGLSLEALTSRSDAVDIPENAAVCASRFSCDIPEGSPDILVLSARVVDFAGGVLSENHYLMSSAPPPIFSSLTNIPKAGIRVLGTRHLPGGIAIEVGNDSSNWALFVRADAKDSRTGVYFKNNFVTIPPGGKSVIKADMAKPVSAFSVVGWNTNLEEVP